MAFKWLHVHLWRHSHIFEEGCAYLSQFHLHRQMCGSNNEMSDANSAQSSSLLCWALKANFLYEKPWLCRNLQMVAVLMLVPVVCNRVFCISWRYMKGLSKTPSRITISSWSSSFFAGIFMKSLNAVHWSCFLKHLNCPTHSRMINIQVFSNFPIGQS